MSLNNVEREKITDSVLKIQSARSSLEGIGESKVPGIEALEHCLESGDKKLRDALRK